jgi:hypothetical protein
MDTVDTVLRVKILAAFDRAQMAEFAGRNGSAAVSIAAPCQNLLL